MKGLGETIAGLQRYRDAMAKLPGLDGGTGQIPPDIAGTGPASRLEEVTSFGGNPGNLRMYRYVPPGLGRRAPLVVVLHGCLQNAAGYDNSSGWSALADRCGFALLFPEQQASNNPQRCLNWFEPGDTRRDAGEALSIRQMIAHMVEARDLDPRRVFVTGLSAGGAMTNVMLATYPELFAGGAIIAGLPYGAADNVASALAAMRGERSLPAAELGDFVRQAADYHGPWPPVAVWHGTSDSVVVPANGDAVVAQWINVHRLPSAPTSEDRVDGVPHRVWRAADGRVLVESYMISGMSHGTPLAVGGAEPLGVAGPYMLDAGISSTLHIARSWGLTEAMRPYRATAQPTPRPSPRPLQPPRRPLPVDGPTRPDAAPPPPRSFNPRRIIEDALRAAGLMKGP